MSVEAYAESERIMRALHDLEMRGLGDTPESEDLCDQAEAPWYAMTEEECDKIDQLSVDLWAEYDASVMRNEAIKPAPEAS